MIGLVGIAVLLGLATLGSTNWRRISWGPIGIALLLQLVLAALVLRTSVGEAVLEAVNAGATAFIETTDYGIDFLFGSWPARLMGADGEPVDLPYVFAIRVLPIVIFMASVFSVLYHLGILQRVVDWLARGLRRAMRISGAESLATIANVFLGMTEAPLMIRPYVAGLTRSELFCVMTAGLATVAGSILVAYVGLIGADLAGHLVTASFMSAPAAIGIAKIMIPEEGAPQSLGGAHLELTRDTVNVIDAAASGAAEGMRLALNIGAMLIAFVALVYGLNACLGWAGGFVGLEGITFERLLGLGLAPLAFLLGVPWVDAPAVGEMLGIKTILNEFLGFQMLANVKDTLEPRSVVIASYALCGFANFGSLAILLGGLGGIAPERRPDIARDGLRALIAGSLATFLTGAIAGLVY
ncbi:MAG: nucleoside transporter C-terminal domain-containing protein [Myxococcota bacterium]